jgi:hypothetical protein
MHSREPNMAVDLSFSLCLQKVLVCSPETFDFIYPSMGHGKEE